MRAPKTSNGYIDRTKRLIAAAYEVWRIKNGLPKYDTYGRNYSVENNYFE